MKIKISKNKKSFKKEGYQINPNISWEFILSIAVLLIIASFIFGFYLFMQINQEPILADTNDSGQVPRISKDQILKVLGYFSEREKKSAEIVNSPAPIVDPSL